MHSPPIGLQLASQVPLAPRSTRSPFTYYVAARSLGRQMRPIRRSTAGRSDGDRRRPQQQPAIDGREVCCCGDWPPVTSPIELQGGRWATENAVSEAS